MKKNDVVVITGATAGVGRAVARLFAKKGARIGLLARGEDGLEETEREIRELGGDAYAISTDVASFAEVEAAANLIEQRLGPIDIWINNAMATVFAPIKKIEPDEFRRSTEVTYLGSVWGTMVALKRMVQRNGGTIVQVGSALAYRSIPLQAPYCGAKHALVGFIDSLRSELIHDKSKVKVTMVHLPALNTPQFEWARNKMRHHPQPVPPIYEPEVAAEAIYHAAYHPRREVYVGFPTVKAIWGQKLIPGLLDYYLGKTGYRAQQTAELVDAKQPNNLFEPVEGHHTAHGSFDSRSRTFSPELWFVEHKWPIMAGVAGIVASAYVASKFGSENGHSLAFRRK